MRYRVGVRRFSTTFKGSKTEASKELRRLVHSGDTGEHVSPSKVTFAAWVDHWISLGCPGKSKQEVTRRTVSRYAELLRVHVKPVLGKKVMQKITATDIDKLYAVVAGKVSGTTCHHIHVVLGSCLSAAVRKKIIPRSPVDGVERVPKMSEFDHIVLDEADLVRLVEGFKGSTIYPIVAVAAYTGARLREVLALRWVDVDLANRTISITRAIEEGAGWRGIKKPKTARGVRTIQIDGGLAGLLAAYRERQQRLVAGIPDGVEDVDLSLVRLPDGALLFPGGAGADLTQLGHGNNVSTAFRARADRLGFHGFRFHDLRGSDETALLDRGIPVHVVAARCGHDPAMLLRVYARRTKKADDTAAAGGP